MWDSASSGPTYQISNNLSNYNTCGIHTRYTTFFCDFDLLLMSREMSLTKLVSQWTIEKLSLWLVSRLCRSSHQRCSKRDTGTTEFCKIFKNIFFTEHPRTTASGSVQSFQEICQGKEVLCGLSWFSLTFVWVFANLSKKWSKLTGTVIFTQSTDYKTSVAAFRSLMGILA